MKARGLPRPHPHSPTGKHDAAESLWQESALKSRLHGLL